MIDIDINDLIGKPFKGGARGPNEYDCWGLAIEVQKRAGKYLPNFSISGPVCLSFHKIIASTIEEEVIKDRWKELDKPEDLCLIIFKSHPYFVQHIGTYLGNDKYIHTTKNSGVLIDRITNPIKRQKIRGYYKYVTSKSK